MFIKEMKECCINGFQLWNNLLLYLNNASDVHWINLLHSRGPLTCMTTMRDSRLLTHSCNILLLYLILQQYLREIQHYNKTESLQQCSLMLTVFWLFCFSGNCIRLLPAHPYSLGEIKYLYIMEQEQCNFFQTGELDYDAVIRYKWIPDHLKLFALRQCLGVTEEEESQNHRIN